MLSTHSSLSPKHIRSDETPVSSTKLEGHSQVKRTQYNFQRDPTLKDVQTPSGTYSGDTCTQLGGVKNFCETVGQFAADHYKAAFHKDKARGPRSPEREGRKASNRRSTNARNRAERIRTDALENMYIALTLQDRSLSTALHQIDAEIRALRNSLSHFSVLAHPL